MAMEKDYIVHDTHTKSITALGCNPARRELYLGFEDGCIKSLELDTGNLIQTYNVIKSDIMLAFIILNLNDFKGTQGLDNLIHVLVNGQALILFF